jgi:DNA-directed RNA polymerase subunit RPC12/RpoP
MVSHMAALEQALSWWINQARWLLDPVSKVELTRTTGVRCPHCGADLVAWLRPAAQDQSEIACTSQDPDHDGQRRWQPAEWKRLGVLVGVHEDGRFGARLPDLALSVPQSP